MTPTITAFERSPDRGKGLARDMRIRWALEEVGQPYDVRLLSFSAMKEPTHRALHPFGQIPTYEEGGLALFETGAIVFHIAERHAGLLPDDAWSIVIVSSSETIARLVGCAAFGIAPMHCRAIPGTHRACYTR